MASAAERVLNGIFPEEPRSFREALQRTVFCDKSGAMFSLQSFFGKDDKFLDLLEASATECRASIVALQKILGQTANLSLDEFAATRQRRALPDLCRRDQARALELSGPERRHRHP